MQVAGGVDPSARVLWGVSALALIGYLAVARALGDVYPFSTFPMYGGAALDSASRIVVVGHDGAPAEIEALAAIECEREIDPTPLACVAQWPYAHFPAVDAEAEDAIASRRRSVERGEPVRVVRRIWRFDREGSTTVHDCELARCEAQR